MKCLTSLIFIFLSVSAIRGSQSRSVRESLLERCNQLCARYHRQGPCAGALPRCGPCIHGYVERNGICRDVLNDDRIDAIEELVNEFRELKAENEERQREHQQEGGKPILEAYNLGTDTASSQDLDQGHHKGHKGHKNKHHGDSKVKVEVINDGSNAAPPIHPTPVARSRDDGNPNNQLHPLQHMASMADVYFLAVVAGCSVAGLIGLVVAGVCWYRLQKNVKATSEVEYPAYGITGPSKERAGSPGDRKLAQSAQMYHYQHQKQQMIAMEKANGEMKHDGSEEDSEDENEEGDYTVYECPGLAPTGEMEVKNPLFNDETPVTPTPDDRGGDQK